MMNMKPSLAKMLILCCLKAQISVMLLGSPGIGKSDIVRAIAKLLGIQLLDIRAVLFDPVDFRGIPSIVDGRTVWNPPDFLPTSGKGLLFLDEINAAPKLVQAACYQLVLERRLGDYALPEGWHVIGAGNHASDMAAAMKMSTALKRRFEIINLIPDFEDWKTWAFANNIAAEIIGYLNLRPQNLHLFDPRSDDSFPCPATWEAVSKLMATNPAQEIRTHAWAGQLGEAVAVEFEGFCQIANALPDPGEVFRNPQNAPIPSDMSVMYAYCAALSYRATRENFPAIAEYSERLRESHKAVLVLDCIKAKPEVTETRAYCDWATRNQHLLSA